MRVGMNLIFEIYSMSVWEWGRREKLLPIPSRQWSGQTYTLGTQGLLGLTPRVTPVGNSNPNMNIFDNVVKIWPMPRKEVLFFSVFRYYVHFPNLIFMKWTLGCRLLELNVRYPSNLFVCEIGRIWRTGEQDIGDEAAKEKRLKARADRETRWIECIRTQRWLRRMEREVLRLWMRPAIRLDVIRLESYGCRAMCKVMAYNVRSFIRILRKSLRPIEAR